MSKLDCQINVEKEEGFYLGSMNFFRPPLKQIGNSIYEIKTYYMSKDVINIIPTKCTPDLTRVRDALLTHLMEDSFLYKNNIVNGSTTSRDNKEPSFVVLMDSLALAMDFEISPRPSDVQCDILLAVCGQPVIVLTLVDGDKDSKTVITYNTSVANGVSATLRRFMDESVNVVFGVVCRNDLDDAYTFRARIETIAKDSSLFVTLSSFTTSPSKYEKIVTAFWAGVAETRSVISRDGRVDTDYLRFLTKDQCIILIENINNREVEVQFQSGTGATTLMLEVARRLSRINETLLVCRSPEKIDILRSIHLNTTTASDLPMSDLSKYTNIVMESGDVIGRVSGKIWRFTKVDSEIEKLQHVVDLLEKQNAYREQMVYLLDSVDRQRKMEHLSLEIRTLKLFDINFQGLLSAYHLPTSAAFEFIPLKHQSGNEGSSQTEKRVGHVLDELKQGILKRRDLFPLLGDEIKHDKVTLACLQAKTDFLERALTHPTDDYGNQVDISSSCIKSEETSDKRYGISSTESSDMEEDDLSSIEEQQSDEGHKTLSPESSDMEEDDLSSIEEKESDGGHTTLSTESSDMEKDDLSSSEVQQTDGVHTTLSTESSDMEEDDLSSPEVQQTDGVHKILSQESSEMEEDALSSSQVQQADGGHKTQSPESSDMEEDDLSRTEEQQADGGHKTLSSDMTQESPNARQDYSQTIENLKARRDNLKMEAQSLDRWIRERPEAEEFCVEWEDTMNYLFQEMAGMRIREFIINTIGENEIPEEVEATTYSYTSPGDNISTRRREKRACQIYQLRKMEHGQLKQRQIWDILRNVITDGQRRLTNLRIQSDHMERVYGSPVEIVGEIDTDHGGPVSCPPMTLDRERVDKELAVSEDGLELVNTRGSLDQGTDRLKDYWGTCSRQPIPLHLSPSTLTVPRYWETHSRVQVKGPVLSWILYMGVSREGKVDWIPSWSVEVEVCGKHPGICTKVSEGDDQVGECQTDTMSPTPGTDVTLILGAVLDMGRGRLAFIDVNRGRVLHKFDLDIRESLFPMFGAEPFEESHCDVAMRLVSGREIAMTDEKKSLIATALYSQ